MRPFASFALLLGLALVARAESSGPCCPPDDGVELMTHDEAVVRELVKTLDADDASQRDAAEKRLRECDVEAAAWIRSEGGKLGLEGKSRALAIAGDLEAAKTRREIWGKDADPVAEVKAEMKTLAEREDAWELHRLASPDLENTIVNCCFVIADWVAEERKSVPSQLWVVTRNPKTVKRVRSLHEYPTLSAWLPAATEKVGKERIAGLLSGVEKVRQQFDGPFEFHADKADVLSADAIWADTDLLFVEFDEKGALKAVNSLSEMQRGGRK